MPRNRHLTLRQYLMFRALERGESPTRAQQAIEEFREANPHIPLDDRASWDHWETKREAGVLP